jgi:hypothetical protein
VKWGYALCLLWFAFCKKEFSETWICVSSSGSKLGITATATCRMLKHAFRDKTMGRTQMFDWFTSLRVVEWQQVMMLRIQYAHAWGKQVKMWCESRNPFMEIAVSLSMTLSLFYWLTSKGRIVSVCVRGLQEGLKERSTIPHMTFSFFWNWSWCWVGRKSDGIFMI